MQRVRTVDDVAKLGSILSVWAHPDDETFLAGGLLRAAVQNGQPVVCLTATHGEAGVYDTKKWPAEDIPAIRTKELAKACQILGIHNHHFLDYKDGECAQVDEKTAGQKIAAFIERYKPDTILTFGGDGWTGHPDHQAVSRWVDAAAEFTSHKPMVFHGVVLDELYKNYYQIADRSLDIFFNTDHPVILGADQCDICFRLSPELCKTKCDALAAMPSQMGKLIGYFGEEYLQDAFAAEAFVKHN